MDRGNFQFAALMALLGAARKGGNSKWQTARKVSEAISAKAGLNGVRGQVNLVLNNLSSKGLVEYREIQHAEDRSPRKGARGRLPAFEFAITEDGRTYVNSFLSLAQAPAKKGKPAAETAAA